MAELHGTLGQAFEDVVEFHRKFGHPVRETPGLADAAATLRIDLINEECDELVSAILDGDIEGVADGAIDLIYVVLGTLAAYGVDPSEIWDAVHAANMAKSQAKRADGKVVKPAGWQAPDIAAILDRQRESRPVPAVPAAPAAAKGLPLGLTARAD